MSSRAGLIPDVRKILEAFRAANGWEPGKVWDPYAGAYVWPADVTPSPWEAL